MVRIKTPEDIATLKVAGNHLAQVLTYVGSFVRPGISTEELNEKAEEKMKELGDTPAFLGYTPEWAHEAYPAALCVSVNDTVVHGIPNRDPKEIKEGDIVSLDSGVVHNNLYTDSAFSMIAGEGTKEHRKLLQVTKEALEVGIQAARVGNTVGDIGHAIAAHIKPHGYGIVTALAGHGVGYEIHEEPLVPNVGRPGEGVHLEAGMVLAIEPMVTLGNGDVTFLDDGYTVLTKKGEVSAHFEHMVAITDEGPVVLTRRENE